MPRRRVSISVIRPDCYQVECYRPDSTGEEILAERRECRTEAMAFRVSLVWLRGGN